MATKKPLPPRKITVEVPGKNHRDFLKKVRKAGSNMTERLNELIAQDIKV